MQTAVPFHSGSNLESPGELKEFLEKLSALLERVDLIDQGLAIENSKINEQDGRISACEAHLGIDRITIVKTHDEKTTEDDDQPF